MTIEAPAKINLGLEILGRREDGYHDIRSVLTTISLVDRLEFSIHPKGRDEIIETGEAPTGLPTQGNLILTALNALRKAGCVIPPQRIRVTKRIPVAAGLGGASSDAASTIRLFGERASLPDTKMQALALEMGSDVPFFLAAGAALVRGRGEHVQPLPAPTVDSWIVTFTPTVKIPAKTASMYASVKPEWWTDGRLVERFAGTFPTPEFPPPPNVFQLALFTLIPSLVTIRDRLVEAGFPFVAISGAGPTMFTTCTSESLARDLAAKAGLVDAEATVHVARLCHSANCCHSGEDGGR